MVVDEQMDDYGEEEEDKVGELKKPEVWNDQ